MEDKLHIEELLTTWLLVRHGETEFTRKGKLYCCSSVPLINEGIIQIQTLAQSLANVEIDKLLVSNTARTMQTADIICRYLSRNYTIINELEEWNVGLWDGLSYQEIKNKFPKLYFKWLDDPIRHSPPEGESIITFYNRCTVGFTKLQNEYKGQRILTIVHSGVIRSILIWALGMPIKNFWRLSIPVASITELVASDNFATLKYMSCSKPN